jgi:mRNA deadenylase 3'-5' endonuclease subunit Ccr4
MTAMTFRVATYNVLATAYLSRGDYRTPPALLRPEWRVPALTAHIESLGADLLCLQEVEAGVFAEFDKRLSAAGYEGLYERKAGGRPDGCATFFRKSRFVRRQVRRIEYHDREAGLERHSGSIASLVSLEVDGRLLGVANTHLRWQRPGVPRDQQVGLRQVAELLSECQHVQPAVDGWVICGDFNWAEGSDVFREMTSAGYAAAHAGRPGVWSNVSNGKAKLIDFIFHTAALVAQPLDPPPVSDESILPSQDQPSDHLALEADLAWRTS